MQTIVRNTPIYPFFTNTVRHFSDDLINKESKEKKFTNPAVNILNDGETIYVQIAVPGLQKEDFEIIVSDKTLEVKVNRKEEKDIKWQKKEFDYSQFKKVFTLSKEIDKENINVKYDAGILSLVLQKIERKEESKRLLVQ